MQHNVGLILEKRAFLTPNLPALYDVATGIRLTYAELNQRANQAANAFLSLGIKKGDRVGLLLMNGQEFVESIFGLAKIGAITVPLNWRLLADELEFILNDCGVSLLVFDSDFCQTVEKLHAKPTGVKTWLQVRAHNNELSFAKNYEQLVQPAIDVSPATNTYDDDDLFIMYTSGTTGLPKGVVHTHDTAMWSTITSSASIDMRIRDRFLVILPLFHIGALNPTMTCIKKGAALIIARNFDPASVWRLINDEEITTMLAVPAMLNFMRQAYDSQAVDHAQLRYCLVGAAPVAESLIKHYQQLGICLIQVYGLTESCGPGCVLDEHEALQHIGSTGKAYFHTEVKIIKDDGETAAPNESGEILIRGRHIMKEYWNNPEATALTLRNGWLYTGDVGSMDAEGFVTIKDRIKDMIISGGENVYPAEVENVLLSHPAVLEAAIIGKSHPKWGETPLAIVVKKSEDLAETDIIAFCKAKLASYKCPTDVVFIEALPRNPSGKILKRVLREQLISTPASEETEMDPA